VHGFLFKNQRWKVQMFWGKYGYYVPWGLKMAYGQDTTLFCFCSEGND
jgi:hypothetical protein